MYFRLRWVFAVLLIVVVAIVAEYWFEGLLIRFVSPIVDIALTFLLLVVAYLTFSRDRPKLFLHVRVMSLQNAVELTAFKYETSVEYEAIGFKNVLVVLMENRSPQSILPRYLVTDDGVISIFNTKQLDQGHCKLVNEDWVMLPGAQAQIFDSCNLVIRDRILKTKNLYVLDAFSFKHKTPSRELSFLKKNLKELSF